MNQIIRNGEFKNKRFEKEFFETDVKESIKNLKLIILGFGLLFLMLIIPDYFIVGPSKSYIYVSIGRIIFSISVIYLYFKLKSGKTTVKLQYWFTYYEIIASLLYLFTLYQYESFRLPVKSFGVILIILSIYLIPNKWKFMNISTLILITGYIGLSSLYIKPYSSEFLSVVLFIMLSATIVSVYSYRINYYKRIHYLNHKKLEKKAVTDELTGIYNRAKLNDELYRWIDISKRNKSNLSIVMFDIDDFKTVNDKHGHLIGDSVAVKIANIVKNTMRETDIFARWGGDEFIILMPYTNKLQAYIAAERIRKLIAKNKFNAIGYVSCSFGVVSFEDKDDVNSFLQKADKKLYLAKSLGKNIVC